MSPKHRRPRNNPDAPVGLLVVDKPEGMGSASVVYRVRKATDRAKVGHAGTLDPLATGVVICCLGRAATRLVDQLMGLTKIYEAAVDLSAFTTTDDREGPREEIAVASPPASGDIQAALQSFIGNVSQTPPAYSAIHVDGQRAYKLARAGQDVAIKPRIVRIDSIELLSYEWPIAHLRITCGKGTYIRSIARDLGNALHTGGHLASLRRTAVGPYTVENAVTIERLDQPLTQADLLPLPDVSSP